MNTMSRRSKPVKNPANFPAPAEATEVPDTTTRTLTPRTINPDAAGLDPGFDLGLEDLTPVHFPMFTFKSQTGRVISVRLDQVVVVMQPDEDGSTLGSLTLASGQHFTLGDGAEAKRLMDVLGGGL